VLKDEIERASGIIADCKVTNVFNIKSEKAISKIQDKQSCTSKALSILLSNHGGDWIDQTVAGGLSFAEFSSLDIGTIRAFEREFRKCGDELERQRLAKSYDRETRMVPESSQSRTSLEDQKWMRSSKTVVPKPVGNVGKELDQFKHIESVIKRLNVMLKVKIDVEKGDEGVEKCERSDEEKGSADD
jgi:hypothetical protein